ncbi:unnamed protein product [Boreogadus saida]
MYYKSRGSRKDDTKGRKKESGGIVEGRKPGDRAGPSPHAAACISPGDLYTGSFPRPNPLSLHHAAFYPECTALRDHAAGSAVHKDA